MSVPQPLDPGQKAPLFSYQEDGVTVKSSALSTPYLIYFYPKDDTPGCTKKPARFATAGLHLNLRA